MQKPREVFDDPDRFLPFLTAPTDDQFEGPHFDRKEAGNSIAAKVKACISAFANSNVEGGLLVLGIATDGKVKGVDHLTEDQQNSITNFNNLLINQSAEAKWHKCTDENGKENHLLLIFAPYTERAICETLGQRPEGWIRSGPQNIPLTQEMRDRLRRNKQIVDFENTICCDFDISDVDADVLSEFRREFLKTSMREYNDEELLYQAGAIVRVNGEYKFTNAGLLFFATNPQRIFSGATIRLLRLNVNSDDTRQRSLPTFDQYFSGSLTQQLRKARTFFRESGFFKNYQVRKPEGGFREEPELPSLVIDEAIVNAIAHRDYATGIPIECKAYKDAFIINNPGRMIQRDVDLPNEFSLANQVLDSMPRNPKLLKWLQIMKDPDGKAFVQALSEGTKTMAAEMEAMNLPPPEYRLSDFHTSLKLISNAATREAAFLEAEKSQSIEVANLYLLNIKQGGKPVDKSQFRLYYKELLKTLGDKLIANNWYIDKLSFGRIITHRRGTPLDIPTPASSILNLYPAYEINICQFYGYHYLSVDYRIQVLNVRSLDKLLRHISVDNFIGSRCVAKKDGWHEGKIMEIDEEWVGIKFFHNEVIEKAPSSSVIPYCPLRVIETVLKRENVNFDLHQTLKTYSLASKTGASRLRADKIASMTEYIADTLLPISFGDFEVSVNKSPTALREFGTLGTGELRIKRLSEPIVEFRAHHSSTDVRDGITRYGSYEENSHVIELIPICLSSQRQNMRQLIERISTGKYKYRGSERTFSTRFTHSSIITVESVEEVAQEVSRLLEEHPDWIGNEALNRIFLIHTPEQGYAADDETSPYYVVKGTLLEKGIPCQMVDTPTLLNPDWKDLNLALNITAKCGITPWVLPDAIPDADFFIGLSYTESRDRKRVMGFANVFNRYGKWEFYRGNTKFFDFDRKTEWFAKLVKETLQGLKLSLTPNVVFHYSAKFSREDREAILQAARSVCPEGTYSFIWVNSHHNIRIFDRRAETDGSLRRGSYVQTSPHQIYLSTTGYNPFRRALGTPKPLEINTWIERPPTAPVSPPDIKSIAVQVLSLTKLNWASTDAFTGEPITLKYAGDIAYLTAAFLRQKGEFKLHPVLEKTPWFL